MRLTDFDREQIADVAAFCSTDRISTKLQHVWMDRGWAYASDRYRVDFREIDCTDAAMVNPFTFHRRPIDEGFKALSSIVEAFNMVKQPGRLLEREMPVDVVTRAKGDWLWCMRCDQTWLNHTPLPCRCVAPVVNRQFLWEALQAADEPSVRWTWLCDKPLRPAVYAEDEHVHALMPVRVS